MADSAAQEIDEELAQLGIKKGSLLWPILAVIIAAILLTVYLQPSDKTVLDTLFVQVCAGAHNKEVPANTTLKLAKDCHNPAEPSVPSPAMINQFEIADIITKWRVIDQLTNVEGNDADKYVRGNVWPLIVESAKDYTKGLFKEFGQIILGVLQTALIAALVSLIPGLAGMIYRRNFWGWFAVPFVGIFVVTSGLLGQLSIEAKFLVFLLTQLVIVLLALRLQRFSAASGSLPPALHNWLLTGILIILAVLLALKYPEGLWKNVPWLSSPFYRWEMII